MNLSKENIIEKLKSINYNELKTGKSFYSLKDVLKEFNIKHLAVGLVATTKIFKRMDEISYPCRTLYTLKKNAGGIVEDVYLNPVGLMLVLAQSSQMLKKEADKELCLFIANVLKEEQPSFYPERRLLFRNEYKESFKELSSKVKQKVNGDTYRSLSSHIAKLHYTILSDYFFVTELERISYKKTGSYSKNYLDYISLRELKDLSEINKTLIKDIEKYPNTSFIELARSEATKKRREFFLNYAGVYPFEYRSHNNTPKQMLKEFDNLLKELNLTPNISIKKDKNTKKQTDLKTL